jgi:hypothetical protein
LEEGLAVAVPVMNVGGMFVVVEERSVAVRVGVFALHRRLVHVVVVAVVVLMGVLVFEGNVSVQVSMSFGQMQEDPEPEQSRG